MTLKEYREWCDEVLHKAVGQEYIDAYLHKLGPDEIVGPLVDGKLKEVLGERQVEYILADWKDPGEFIRAILGSKFDLQHASTEVYSPFSEIEGGHGGSDDFVLIAISGEATSEELDIVFDLMHNLGAEV